MKASGIDTSVPHASTNRVLRHQAADQGPQPYTRGRSPETQQTHGSTRSANLAGTTPTPKTSFVRTERDGGPFYEARHALMNKTRRLFGQPQQPTAYARQATMAQHNQQAVDFVLAMRQAYPDLEFKLSAGFGGANFHPLQNPALLEQVSRL